MLLLYQSLYNIQCMCFSVSWKKSLETWDVIYYQLGRFSNSCCFSTAVENVLLTKRDLEMDLIFEMLHSHLFLPLLLLSLLTHIGFPFKSSTGNKLFAPINGEKNAINHSFTHSIALGRILHSIARHLLYFPISQTDWKSFASSICYCIHFAIYYHHFSFCSLKNAQRVQH